MDKKKGGIGKKIAFGAAGLAIIAGITGSQQHSSPSVQLNVTPINSNVSQAQEQKTQPVQDVTPAPTTAPSTGVTDTNLSNSNTYTNADDTAVHSPAYSTDGSVPDGATARCLDGTYSFSQHHSGTCSHHGGVETWL